MNVCAKGRTSCGRARATLNRVSTHRIASGDQTDARAHCARRHRAEQWRGPRSRDELARHPPRRAQRDVAIEVPSAELVHATTRQPARAGRRGSFDALDVAVELRLLEMGGELVPWTEGGVLTRQEHDPAER